MVSIPPYCRKMTLTIIFSWGEGLSGQESIWCSMYSFLGWVPTRPDLQAKQGSVPQANVCKAHSIFRNIWFWKYMQGTLCNLYVYKPFVLSRYSYCGELHPLRQPKPTEYVVSSQSKFLFCICNAKHLGSKHGRCKKHRVQMAACVLWTAFRKNKLICWGSM